MDTIVKRSFDMDFIYFDLIFVCIWMAYLIRKQYSKEFLIGIFGFLVNFIADFIIWYSIQGDRVIQTLPINDVLFFLYFGFTYGMIEFSYVFVMFNEKTDKIRWTAMLYGGWILIGFLSQWVSLDDRTIIIWREMAGDRTVQIIMMAVGFLLLLGFASNDKIEYKTVIYVFLVGFLVHFAMEISLFLPGIRNGSFDILFFNSFIEFNTGAPVLFLISYYWRKNNSHIESPVKDKNESTVENQVENPAEKKNEVKTEL